MHLSVCLRRAWLWTMCGCFLAPPFVNAAEKLPSNIIANVQANEALYPNVEVRWRREFKSALPSTDHGSMPPFLSKTMTERYHSIAQEEKTYVEYTCDAINFADEIKRVRTRHGFDGKTTRVDSESMGHIYEGRVDPTNLFRPHTWAFWRSFVTFPLSVWLRGGDEVKGHPSKTHANEFLVSFMEKSETVDGVHCICVRIDTHKEEAGGSLLASTLVWIAPERNYLPLKLVSSWPEHKGTIEEIRIDGLREIKPGLWFPYHYKLISYEDKGGKRVLRNEEEGFVESVSLEAMSDEKVFSDIKFSKNATVYKVTGDKVKNITKEYHEKYNSGGLYYCYLAGAAVLAALMSVGIIVWQRRTRQAALAANTQPVP